MPHGRLAVALMLAPILATAVPAAPDAPAPRAAPGAAAWLRVDAADFTLLGRVGEARLRRIASRLEAFRSALERLHPGARSSPRETTVFVFEDAAAGRPYAPSLAESGDHLGRNAPYDVPNDITVAAPVDDPPLEPLYHAYTHQFLDDNFPRLPLAVTEGLAEFASGFLVTPGETLIGVPIANHVAWLKSHPPSPPAELFSLEARSPRLADATGRAAFMASSWALMHDLLAASDQNRERLPALLRALQHGAPPGDALLAAYGLSYGSLQQEVAGYAKDGRFAPLLVRRGSPDDSPVRVRPMGPDEVEAALGDLLAHGGPRFAAAAETHLRESLRLNPSQARAFGGLGSLRYAEDRFAEAIPFLERAVDLDPDAMSCYLLARSLLRVNTAAPAERATPPWRARARSLLARAIELDPRFAAPYVALGATQMEPDGDVADGIDRLRKALAMLPARMDIAGNLVYLHLRNGDVASAQALVDGALAESGDAEALRSARQAVATYRENVAAKQSLVTKEVTPEEKARREAGRARMIASLRSALAETSDPEKRSKIEKLLEFYESGTGDPDYNRDVEIYNEAVDRANRRDYAGAIALLEDLLPKVKEPDLRDRIAKTLDQFRRDGAKFQQQAP